MYSVTMTPFLPVVCRALTAVLLPSLGQLFPGYCTTCPIYRDYHKYLLATCHSALEWVGIPCDVEGFPGIPPDILEFPRMWCDWVGFPILDCVLLNGLCMQLGVGFPKVGWRVPRCVGIPKDVQGYPSYPGKHWNPQHGLSFYMVATG